jgi:hypothetical protein
MSAFEDKGGATQILEDPQRFVEAALAQAEQDVRRGVLQATITAERNTSKRVKLMAAVTAVAVLLNVAVLVVSIALAMGSSGASWRLSDGAVWGVVAAALSLASATAGFYVGRRARAVMPRHG